MLHFAAQRKKPLDLFVCLSVCVSVSGTPGQTNLFYLKKNTRLVLQEKVFNFFIVCKKNKNMLGICLVNELNNN